MGARGANFHFEVFARMGYEDVATKVQELYLEGRKADAAAAIPLAMVEDVALVGPPDKIRAELPAMAGHVHHELPPERPSGGPGGLRRRAGRLRRLPRARHLVDRRHLPRPAADERAQHQLLDRAEHDDDVERQRPVACT